MLYKHLPSKIKYIFVYNGKLEIINNKKISKLFPPPLLVYGPQILDLKGDNNKHTSITKKEPLTLVSQGFQIDFCKERRNNFNLFYDKPSLGASISKKFSL